MEQPRTPEEHTIQEHFIGAETNVVHLFGSTEMLLKDPTYTVLFDSNIYPSIEGYLKDRPLEGIDAGLLYKAKLGIGILSKILGKYPNLLILPAVAEEVDHMSGADLAQLRKKRELYERLPVGAKNDLLDIHNRLGELAGLIAAIREAYKEKARSQQGPRGEIYGPILTLLKFLDEHLGTKKAASRDYNDTDERIVAAAYYQMLYENRKVAIYTRDEDVKRLVSTAFRFLKHLGTRGRPALGNRLGFTNVIVFKYNYEKRVFSRFFESETVERPDDFFFPSRLREQEKAAILSGGAEIAAEIEKVVGTSGPAVDPSKEKPTISGGEKALRHIAALVLDEGRFVAAEGEEEALERENDLEQLLVLGRYFASRDVIAQVEAALEEVRQERLENQIRHLEARGGELGASLAKLTVPRADGIDFEATRNLARLAAEMTDNLIERLVLSVAIEEKRLTLRESDVERVRKAVGELEKKGIDIQREQVALSIDEIEALSGMPSDRIIGLVQSRKIPHEGRRVYLDLKGLARLFLAGA